jgi:hypothetical protein
MRFYPLPPEPPPGNVDKDWKEKLGDSMAAIGNSLVSSAKSTVKNLANNLTGGILGSIINGKVDIMKQHDTFIHAG